MLEGIGAAELRRLFGARDDDPMYDCWPGEREHVERLTVAVDHDLDLERHDYFVEAFRDGEDGDSRCPPRVLPLSRTSFRRVRALPRTDRLSFLAAGYIRSGASTPTRSRLLAMTAFVAVTSASRKPCASLSSTR